jgi:hypothetical protein
MISEYGCRGRERTMKYFDKDSWCIPVKVQTEPFLNISQKHYSF